MEFSAERQPGQPNPFSIDELLHRNGVSFVNLGPLRTEGRTHEGGHSAEREPLATDYSQADLARVRSEVVESFNRRWPQSIEGES